MNAAKRTKAGRRDRRTITDLEIGDDLVRGLVSSFGSYGLEIRHLILDLCYQDRCEGWSSSHQAKTAAENLGLVNLETLKFWDDENERFDYRELVSLTTKGKRVALILASAAGHQIENHKDDPVDGCHWCQVEATRSWMKRREQKGGD